MLAVTTYCKNNPIKYNDQSVYEEDDIGDEATIIKWNHEEGEITNSWNRLIDWLMAEIKIGSMIINYDGTDKDL